MPDDTWLKLHTSLLTSERWVSLPSNEHRHAYVTLLVLAKKRLLSAPVSYIAGMMHVSEERWIGIKNDLIGAGLLDTNNNVIGFEESQLTPAAARKRRQRAREAERDKERDLSRPMSREKQKAEADKKKNPHTPTPAARDTRLFKAEVGAVVAHLNRVTGRSFDAGRAVDQIVRAFRAGATTDDCAIVIDHLWAKWKDDPKMVQFVDKVTPFRKANFDRYLDEAKAGPVGAGRQAEIPLEDKPWM